MPFKSDQIDYRVGQARADLHRRIAAIALTIGLTAILGVTVARATPSEATVSTGTVVASSPVRMASVAADGVTLTSETHAVTVGELLREREIRLGKLDRCSVPLSTPMSRISTCVVVTRVHAEITHERVVIPYTITKRYTQQMAFGETNVLRPGASGARVKTFRVLYKNETLVSRTKIAETVTPPVSAVEIAGTRGITFSRALASRGYFGAHRLVEMRATGYGPGDNGRWGARTSSGLQPGYGVVAVDPRFIPLGTRLYIEGYGYAIAGDTGGAIRGNRIDLGFGSRSAADAVGRRTVRVLILN